MRVSFPLVQPQAVACCHCNCVIFSPIIGLRQKTAQVVLVELMLEQMYPANCSGEPRTRTDCSHSSTKMALWESDVLARMITRQKCTEFSCMSKPPWARTWGQEWKKKSGLILQRRPCCYNLSSSLPNDSKLQVTSLADAESDDSIPFLEVNWKCHWNNTVQLSSVHSCIVSLTPVSAL